MITIAIHFDHHSQRECLLVYIDGRYSTSFWSLPEAVAYAEGLKPLGLKLHTADIIPLRREVAA